MRSQFLTKIDKRVLSLAYPIILANISIPLLGLTDTAVIGHLGALDVLGISIGAVLMGSIYWFFGFLRMGATGLVAQARGANEYVEVSSILVRGLVIAAVGGIILIAFLPFLFSAIFYFGGRGRRREIGNGVYVDKSLWSPFCYFYVRLCWLVIWNGKNLFRSLLIGLR